MGQSIGKEFDLESIKDELLKEAHIVGDLAVLTYPRFLEMLKEVNTMFLSTPDASGKILFFYQKGGSAATVFWKATVRVICFRMTPGGDDAEECKSLNLKQFIQAYRVIIYHIKPMMESKRGPSIDSEGAAEAAAESAGESSIRELHRSPLSTSMILNKIAGEEPGSDMEECCICMERKPEITLPCAHSYCLLCIEQWNVSNKTCPVCREALENTDDSWVLPEIPESSEVSEETQKVLNMLTTSFPKS